VVVRTDTRVPNVVSRPRRGHRVHHGSTEGTKAIPSWCLPCISGFRGGRRLRRSQLRSR